MAIELAEYLPPNYELSWVDAMNSIQTQPPPTLREPLKWSTDFAEFLALCLVKDPRKRAAAVALLQHPFLQREFPPDNACLKSFVLGEISPRGHVARSEESGRDAEGAAVKSPAAVPRTSQQLVAQAVEKEGGICQLGCTVS